MLMKVLLGDLQCTKRLWFELTPKAGTEYLPFPSPSPPQRLIARPLSPTEGKDKHVSGPNLAR